MTLHNDKLWQSSDGMGAAHTHTGRKQGVYAIIQLTSLTNKPTVVYIGRSMFLSGRLKSHPIYNMSVKQNFPTAIKWKWCSNSIELEEKLIKRLKPMYNKNLKWRVQKQKV